MTTNLIVENADGPSAGGENRSESGGLALTQGAAIAAGAVPVSRYREACTGGGRCLGGCLSTEPCYRASHGQAPAQVDGAAICEAEARKWEKEAKKHQRKPGSLPSKHEARDLERAALCRSIAEKIRSASPQAAQQAPAGPCAICGSDEPFTGTCGSGDPRALCKQPTPSPQAAQQAPAGATSPWSRALEIRIAQGWMLKGDRLPVLYTDTINGDGVGRDDLWLCTTSALAAPAAPSTPEAGGWMPIETAPKDGTRFLAAARINCSDGTSWWERHAIYVDEETGIVFYDGGDDTGWELTDYRFWQPLPASPTIEGESNV